MVKLFPNIAGLFTANTAADGPCLRSGLPLLDDFFAGGLPFGAVCEWGVPLGHGGRQLLIPWVAAATDPATSGPSSDSGGVPSPVLWVVGHKDLMPYPPAWAARGVSLEYLRFAASAQPLKDLRPVFLEPAFRLIVIDTPRLFTPEDCAFVARQARLHRQIVAVLRDMPLSAARGNVWARLRVNVMRDTRTGHLQLTMLRGLSPRQLLINDELVFNPGSPDAPSALGMTRSPREFRNRSI